MGLAAVTVWVTSVSRRARATVAAAPAQVLPATAREGSAADHR